jgi:hypothetical protein
MRIKVVTDLAAVEPGANYRQRRGGGCETHPSCVLVRFPAKLPARTKLKGWPRETLPDVLISSRCTLAYK